MRLQSGLFQTLRSRQLWPQVNAVTLASHKHSTIDRKGYVHAVLCVVVGA